MKHDHSFTLKGVLLLLICLGWLLPFLASAQTVPVEMDSIKMDVNVEFNGEFFRVLDIGNSYTVNSTSYLKELTDDLSLDTSDVCLYRAVFSGGTFKNWHDVYNGTDTSTYYVQKVFGGTSCEGVRDFETCHGSSAMRKLLEENEWELVIIHQASCFAPYYGTWLSDSDSGYLEELLEIIRHCQPHASIGTHLVHSYSTKSPYNKENLTSAKRWRMIASSVKRMAERHNIDIVIPYGTVIERLRGTQLNNKYDLLADGTHLSPGLACYAATCCYYETVFAPRFKVSMSGNKLRPEGDPSVNDESAAIVWDVVGKACADPYQIIDEWIPESGIKARIQISDNTVTITNVTVEERISIYTLEGQVMQELKIQPSAMTTQHGVAYYEIAEGVYPSFTLSVKLPRGVSVLRINNECIKIFIP